MNRRVLVLDAGAVIQGYNRVETDEDLYTIQEVVREIRDSKSKERLASFPFKLQLAEPHPACVAEGISPASSLL